MTTDDTMVELRNGVYGQIIDIINSNGVCYLKMNIILTTNEKPFDVPHIEKIDQQIMPATLLVKITELKRKLLHIDVGENKYLCKFTNDFEINAFELDGLTKNKRKGISSRRAIHS